MRIIRAVISVFLFVGARDAGAVVQCDRACRAAVRTCEKDTCAGLTRAGRADCRRRCRCLNPAVGSCLASERLTFLHLNDLHAHLVPHADLIPDAPQGATADTTRVVERGGVVRLATLVKQVRAEEPTALLVNVGDTFHGGVEALFTNGNAIVDPVNALGVDVGVPGNWDFAYGPVVTRARFTDQPPSPTVLRPNFPHLAANAAFVAPDPRAGQPFLPATLARDVKGVRVGFIGLTSDIVADMHPVLATGLAFTQGESAYRSLIDMHAAALRAQGAQVVAVLSELGIQKDYRLANIIMPGVDVFFSAHTHEATFDPLVSRSGALVVESGNDGYLGRMDVFVANGRVVGRQWHLRAIDADLAEDPEMKGLVDAARAPFLAPDVHMTLPQPTSPQVLDRPIDSVVGHTEGTLSRRDALESSFNRAMTDLLRVAGGTAVAMSPGFRFDSVVPGSGVPLEANEVATGAITVEDVYRFFPVPYWIASGQVRGGRLREILEDGLTRVFSFDGRPGCGFRGNPRRPPRRPCPTASTAGEDAPGTFRQRGGWFDGFSGLRLTVDLTRADGERVTDLRLADTGEVIGDDSVVSVTGCSRLLDTPDTLCSYGGFSAVAPLINPSTGQPWTPVDLFVAALAAGPLPAATRRDVEEVDPTSRWPQTPFVQPLTSPRDYGTRRGG